MLAEHIIYVVAALLALAIAKARHLPAKHVQRLSVIHPALTERNIVVVQGLGWNSLGLVVPVTAVPVGPVLARTQEYLNRLAVLQQVTLRLL